METPAGTVKALDGINLQIEEEKGFFSWVPRDQERPLF